ncbi:MAG: DNA repair exonuclease [Pseudomonadota bacterium]
MRFRFLHTADWQLGKPFGGFDTETSMRLQDERFQVISRIGDIAAEQGVRDILVAGDVFDQEQPSDRVLRRAMDRMGEKAPCRWWLLPGNHDPAGPDSLWDRLAAGMLPSNVHPLLTPEPHDLEPGVTLLSAPWTSKDPGRDLTEVFDNDGEGIRIGIAHGSVQAFGSDPDQTSIIPSDRADRSGLTYLALGDWHGMKQAGPRAWYPGTPEADSFINNTRGQVLLVDTDEPDAPQALSTGTFTWLASSLTCAVEETSLEPLQALFDLPALDTVLISLTLQGALTLPVKTDWDRYLAEQASRLAALRIDHDALDVITDTSALNDLLGDGVLSKVAARLSADGSPDAEAALQLLDAYARR